MLHARVGLALLLVLTSSCDLNGLCAKTGATTAAAAARRIMTPKDATGGPRTFSQRKTFSQSELDSSFNSGPSAADGNCSAAGDSVFVNSSIEHVGGCYGNRQSTYGFPIFVKHGIPVMRHSSILFAHNGSIDTFPGTPSESDSSYYWSIWRLDNASETGWTTISMTCSAKLDEPGVDPTDVRLLGKWICSEREGGLRTSLPADFDGVHCRPGCNNPRAFAAGGDSHDSDSHDDSDDGDNFDRDVGTVLYAILVIAAIILVTAGIVFFCRRMAPPR